MTVERQKAADGEPTEPIIAPETLPTLKLPETTVPVLLPGQASPLEDHHWEFATFEEDYVRSYIQLADTKAAWSFTIASGMLAFLFSQNASQILLLSPQWSRQMAVLLVGIGLLIASAFFSFRVVAPRLKSPSGEGVVFFGAVAAQRSAGEYVSAVAARDKRALTEARLKHCYDVSTVCSRKYQNLKWALWLGLPGLLFSIAYLVLS